MVRCKNNSESSIKDNIQMHHHLKQKQSESALVRDFLTNYIKITAKHVFRALNSWLSARKRIWLVKISLAAVMGKS